MKSNDTPLASGIQRYINKEMSRLHMPGHKGTALPPFGDLLSWDVTEFEGVDSLYEANGIIRETEEAYSKLYGCEASFLSAGGSTLCIQAMLALVAHTGGKIIAGRNIHTAAVNAMALLGLEPLWIYPHKNEDEPLIGKILPQDVEKVLASCPEAAAVYITSPDYFGIISDIAAISKVCRRFGVPLLVDNAHGAHLKFLETSLHPMDLGADLCCDSLHKTLPVITGGALLHIGNPFFISRAKSCMSLFGSTSPSYLIMLSADRCLSLLQGELPEKIRRTIRQVDKLREIALEKGFFLPSAPYDPMRLTLCLSRAGISGAAFDRHLKSHQIQGEFFSDSGCVLLFSPYNTPEDYARVKQAILDAPVVASPAVSYPILRPRVKLSLRDALLGSQEEIPLSQAAGRTAARVQAPCPPGIPLIMPGEVIAPEAIPILRNYGLEKIFVVK